MVGVYLINDNDITVLLLIYLRLLSLFSEINSVIVKKKNCYNKHLGKFPIDHNVLFNKRNFKV